MLSIIIIFVICYLSSPVISSGNSYLQEPVIGITVNHACHLRPPECELHCSFGYQLAPSGKCLCICQYDPCLIKICPPNEYCLRNKDGTAFCVSHIVSQTNQQGIITKPGECPNLIGGTCIQRCKSDGECGGMMKCCSNGCGRECTVALSPLPLVNSLSIHPLQRTGHTYRIGKCPLKNYVKNRNCVLECTHDEDCPWVEKCCDNGCGRVCTPPEKATDCIHLLSAISRLPNKTLAKGYIPKCKVNGEFESIQCDDIYCWCVNQKGVEIIGTKTLKKIALPNCLQKTNCSTKLCSKFCQFGYKTDEAGCPLSKCDCKDNCEEVKCTGSIDICQMVEPECAQPPCQPVPRCLLNPCPKGIPMSLSNTVTALCTHTSQCLSNHWCHQIRIINHAISKKNILIILIFQIGFNAFGFCCPHPEPVLHNGSCAAISSRSTENCKSECKVDSDCSESKKCCFDGCSLRCVLDSIYSQNIYFNSYGNWLNATRKLMNVKGIKVQQIAECPQMPPHYGMQKCSIECQIDEDCPACLHEVITQEIYGYGRVPKCTDRGNYEQIQCDDNICYCVDTISGSEIPATRTELNMKPACNSITERRLDCEPFICPKNCPHGFVITREGCLSCECRNPCKGILCAEEYICVMVSVECLDNVYCPDQPRCVPNVCPSLTSSILIPSNLCKNDEDCPNQYWCNNIGVQSKGICCPAFTRQFRHDAKCKSIEPFTERKEPCKIHCKTDGDCEDGFICCYDGCGTICTSTSGYFQQIFAYMLLNYSSPLVLKDFDLCRILCDLIIRCLQARFAYEKFGLKNAVLCDEKGNYNEIQCDESYCWCVSQTGLEFEGTKVFDSVTPNCQGLKYFLGVKNPKDYLYK
ncbi:unnamed protein product [Thelazia callipaeda]|uniref:Thyroglobulin type-1 domain-containing protein n=1 Tax=Thelazia callipaeda TaxID=103827 RepID=A0A158RC53_THECL|nr:unnamed protein product [Thelazia callipaeda]